MKKELLTIDKKWEIMNLFKINISITNKEIYKKRLFLFFNQSLWICLNICNSCLPFLFIQKNTKRCETSMASIVKFPFWHSYLQYCFSFYIGGVVLVVRIVKIHIYSKYCLERKWSWDKNSSKQKNISSVNLRAPGKKKKKILTRLACTFWLFLLSLGSSIFKYFFFMTRATLNHTYIYVYNFLMTHYIGIYPL